MLESEAKRDILFASSYINYLVAGERIGKLKKSLVISWTVSVPEVVLEPDADMARGGGRSCCRLWGRTTQTEETGRSFFVGGVGTPSSTTDLLTRATRAVCSVDCRLV